MTQWYTLSQQECLKLLTTNPQTGLISTQIESRYQQYGSNSIVEKETRTALSILIDQFTNIMLLMLIAVAIVSAILDLRSQSFPKDSIAIFTIVIINGLLGYFQESRAEKALAALKHLSSPKVRVIRNNQLQEIDSKLLVPGDIMLIEAGVQIAADGRLIEAQNLQIRESALTGEAEAVTKQADLALPTETSLGDRLNYVFKGTQVVHGRGQVLITETGMNTELGKIATMLSGVVCEPTPLQKRMNQLGKILVSGSLTLVAIVVILGIIQSGWSAFEELLEVSLSMAVAVVPEGLPAVVTVSLAIGTQKMIKRNALIRKLPAVETLGSVTTICSDKTGTLTQNKMVVQEIYSNHQPITITGVGYHPSGELLINQTPIELSALPDLELLLTAGIICNDAVLTQEAGDWTIIGDPTEGALLTLGAKKQLNQTSLNHQYPRIAEIPFTSDRKRMSVICETSDHPFPYIMFTKGSSEILLGLSTQLTTDQINHYHLEIDNMAAKGLRVLGLAYRYFNELPSLEQAETDLTWLGIVGIVDPPRPEVKQAVEKCHLAGIKTIMITGDHQLTARAIAQELGIIKNNAKILTGIQLQELTQTELEQQVKQINVYARVSPEHKLRIVQALQAQQEIVAMTGDGVNDAPALKQADIGVAMGITGTDVSKEASDMILLDDNFATIVAATEEGRVVYSNIRRFIKYILGSNIGEVITIGLAPLMGLGGVPLTPLQILWMNLVTDGLPALALAIEPAEPNIMRRPPDNPQDNILAQGLGLYIVRIGIILSILAVTLMLLSYQYFPNDWKTMVFTTLCLAQMGHALAIRSNSQLIIEIGLFSNKYVLGSILLTTILQFMLLYIPPLSEFFKTTPLNPTELAICLGFSLLMFVWVELEKIFIRTILS